MHINYDSIIYIIGNSYGCFAFGLDFEIIEIKDCLSEVASKLESKKYLRINNYTIINTKFFIGIKPQRHINLKGGSIHKVSRNSWKHFKDMPA